MSPMERRSSGCGDERGGGLARGGAAGFTLTELLVVILILTILIAILIPGINTVRDRARGSTAKSLQQAVLTSFAQFRADNNRLPGVFRQDELADRQTGDVFVTAMENAILELAGGVITEEQFTNDPSGAIELTARSRLSGNTERDVYVRPSLIGARGGPGYLELSGDVLRSAPGQLGTSGTIESGADGETLPDIIDPFGMPLLLWQENEFAGANANFVALKPVVNRTAKFYWGVNEAMVNSGQLGEQPRNQRQESLLADRTGITDTDRLLSMVAVVGNPAVTTPERPLGYPDGLAAGGPSGANVVFPAQTRASVILHSAGSDAFYYRQPGPTVTQLAYVPTGDVPDGQVPNNAIPPENADDIISAGGS